MPSAKETDSSNSPSEQDTLVREYSQSAKWAGWVSLGCMFLAAAGVGAIYATNHAFVMTCLAIPILLFGAFGGIATLICCIYVNRLWQLGATRDCWIPILLCAPGAFVSTIMAAMILEGI